MLQCQLPYPLQSGQQVAIPQSTHTPERTNLSQLRHYDSATTPQNVPQQSPQ